MRAGWMLEIRVAIRSEFAVKTLINLFLHFVYRLPGWLRVCVRTINSPIKAWLHGLEHTHNGCFYMLADTLANGLQLSKWFDRTRSMAGYEIPLFLFYIICVKHFQSISCTNIIRPAVCLDVCDQPFHPAARERRKLPFEFKNALISGTRAGAKTLESSKTKNGWRTWSLEIKEPPSEGSLPG